MDHVLLSIFHAKVGSLTVAVLREYLVELMFGKLLKSLVGLHLLCSKFYLLFFPEFPKNFAHYSFDYSHKILLITLLAGNPGVR